MLPSFNAHSPDIVTGSAVAGASGMDAEQLNAISLRIVQAAIEVHRALGPGLLESVYRTCLCYELRARGLTVASELLLPIHYKGIILEGSYRIDLLVENEIIVELKSVETTLPVHYAQLLSYLRLADKRLGLFINFNVPVLVKGIKRIANRL